MIESNGIQYHSYLKSSWWSTLPIAFLTVNRPGTIGFKRNLGLFSAVSTSYGIHFSWRAITSSSSFSIHYYLPIYFSSFLYENLGSTELDDTI